MRTRCKIGLKAMMVKGWKEWVLGMKLAAFLIFHRPALAKVSDDSSVAGCCLGAKCLTTLAISHFVSMIFKDLLSLTNIRLL